MLETSQKKDKKCGKLLMMQYWASFVCKFKFSELERGGG